LAAAAGRAVHENWTVGNFNAWVESGKTRDERKNRLDQVPEQWRKDVELHMKTVESIEFYHAKRGRKL